MKTPCLASLVVLIGAGQPKIPKNKCKTVNMLMKHNCGLVGAICVGLVMATCFLDVVEAGLLAYGICQTGCNALVVSCYAAAGFTFGTVTGGVGVPASIVACNASLGTCMAACVACGAAPTP